MFKIIFLSGIIISSSALGQSLLNLNFWEIQDNGSSNFSTMYPGSDSTPIATLYPFLNSVLYNNGSTWQYHIQGSPFNQYETFDSGKTYLINAKEDFKTIFVPTSSFADWFDFPGNRLVSMADYEPYINGIFRLMPNGAYHSFVPGSPFSNLTDFEPGGRYFVDAKQSILIAYTVPEPSAFSLLALGLGGLALVRRRRS